MKETIEMKQDKLSQILLNKRYINHFSHCEYQTGQSETCTCDIRGRRTEIYNKISELIETL